MPSSPSTVNESFWQRGAWDATSPGMANPWADGPLDAPFSERFYIIMNLAVGGTNGYFPDGAGGKPWSDTDAHADNNFWGAADTQWGPTWTSSDFQIDSVRVWQAPGSGAEYGYRLLL